MEMVRKWPMPKSKMTDSKMTDSYSTAPKWPMLFQNDRFVGQNDRLLGQNDRLCAKMTDSKLPKMTDSWKNTESVILVGTKMTDYRYQNDRLCIPKWPINDKMTDYDSKWPIPKMWGCRKWPIIGLKWPILKFSTHSLWLKWLIMRTKMTDFRGENDRF